MNWPSFTHAPEDQSEVDRMLYPLHPLLFFLIKSLISFVCMKYMEVLSFSPLSYWNKLYHEVFLQYFYNALLKSVSLTKVMYIFSIYSTQKKKKSFVLPRTTVASVQKLEQRSETWAWIPAHCYSRLMIDVSCRNFVITTSANCKCTGNTSSDPSLQSSQSLPNAFQSWNSITLHITQQ